MNISDELQILDSYFKTNVDAHSRTIYLGKDIEEEGTADILKALLFLNSISSKPIKIILNSVGGDEYYMFAIYDAIATSPSFIEIVGCGYIMSAASVILQAADKRVLLPNATMLLHYGTSYFEGHSLDHTRTAKEYERMSTIIEDIYLERIREKKPRFTRQQIQGILQFDTYLSSEDAVKMGLADEVLE